MPIEVSIITSSLNYGRYIESCIQSVKAQRQWHNAKINHIITDGGSKDETLAVLMRHKNDISYSVTPGEGQTAALNHAMRVIEESFPNTTHIGWMNADDFYQDFWLDEMYRQLRKEPENVALICSDMIMLGDDGMRRTYFGVQRYFDKALFGMGANTVTQPSVLIRLPAFKKLKEKYGFYFNRGYEYAPDFELWYRFLDSGYRIRHIPKLTVCLRNHSDRMTHDKHVPVCKERDMIVKKCCEDAGIDLPPWYGKTWISGSVTFP